MNIKDTSNLPADKTTCTLDEWLELANKAALEKAPKKKVARKKGYKSV